MVSASGGECSWVGVKHLKLRWQETNTFYLLTVTITFAITGDKLLLSMWKKELLNLQSNCSPENPLYNSHGVREGSEGLSKTVASQPARQQSVSFCPTFILFGNVRKGTEHFLLHCTFLGLSFFFHLPHSSIDNQKHIPNLVIGQQSLPSPLHFTLCGGEM